MQLLCDLFFLPKCSMFTCTLHTCIPCFVALLCVWTQDSSFADLVVVDFDSLERQAVFEARYPVKCSVLGDSLSKLAIKSVANHNLQRIKEFCKSGMLPQKKSQKIELFWNYFLGNIEHTLPYFRIVCFCSLCWWLLMNKFRVAWQSFLQEKKQN